MSDDRRQQFRQEALPHMDALYNHALSLTRDEASADDLVQETYLKAWRFWDSYTPGTSCKAWLFRILMNTYINQYRRKTRRPQEVDFADVEGHSESKIEDTVKGLDADQRDVFEGLFSDEVKDALDGLPEYFRQVVMLADVEEMTYQEIAEVLDVPIGTVRSRLSRARGLLQDRLTEYARDRGIFNSPSDDDE